MNIFVSLALSILLSHSLATAEEATVPAKPADAKQTEAAKADTADSDQAPAAQPGTSKDLRGQFKWNVSGIYAPVDLILSNKLGVSAAYQPDATYSYEVEYVRGSLSVPFIIEDLGKVTDERLSLLVRSYSSRNSFNFIYGLMYSKFAIRLGDDILNRVTGGSYPSIDLLETQALGAVIGLGNRWHIRDRFTLTVDWASLYQPLYVFGEKKDFLKYATNENDKDDVETAMDIISYFPRFSFVKLELGVSF